MLRAAYHGLAELTNLMTSLGAAVDHQDNYGFAPLHLAAQRGHRDAVIALLDAGADANVRDLKNRTPLKLAQSEVRGTESNRIEKGKKGAVLFLHHHLLLLLLVFFLSPPLLCSRSASRATRLSSSSSAFATRSSAGRASTRLAAATCRLRFPLGFSDSTCSSATRCGLGSCCP